MPIMNSKVLEEYDAGAATLLRNIADGAETGVDTDAETGVSLNTLSGAYWDNDEVPNGLVAVSIYVSALDRADVDETYTFIVEVDTQLAFGGTPTEVGRIGPTGVTSTGYYRVIVDSKMIEKLCPGATHIRIKCTKAGTSPSVTYGAWMTFKGL
jgi:hypothetical protein